MENTNKLNKLKSIFSKKEIFQPNQFSTQNDLLNYYASLAFYHPDIIIVFSRDGEMIAVDHAKIQMLIGKSIYELKDINGHISKTTYKTLKSAFTKTLKGQPEKFEIEVKHLDQHSLFLVITFIPIKNEGNVEGVYLIVSNVTEKVTLRKELLLREKHLNNAQKVAQIGSWEYQIKEDKLYCSDYFYHLYGLDKQEFMGINTPLELVHPDDYDFVKKTIEEAIRNGKNFYIHFRIYHGKNQSIRFLKVHAEVYFEDGKPVKIIGITRDVSYQTQLENQLIEQNDNYEYIFDNLTSGIWMRESIGGEFIFASKGLEEILDIPVSRLYENSEIWFDLIHPNYHEVLENSMSLISEGKSIQTIYRLISGKGKSKWLLEQVVPRINEQAQVTNVFGLVIDITHEMEIEEKLHYLSNHDSLTGLPNQRDLYERIDMLCLKKEEPFVIFYMDIDRFNVINDSLGYSIGDEALKAIAKRFETLTPQDGYLARLSNNNFIMILKNYQTKRDIYKLAEKIIHTTKTPLMVQEYELHVSTSIGITFFPEEGINKKTLLENAHSALIQAKKQGKSTYQSSSYLTDISSYKKYVLDRDMQKAIANEEFELYFQPQVEPVRGQICGAEALIRWNHKEWGLIAPGEFIPLAEENHLINSITDWVIVKVCAYLKEWKEEGFTLQPISINVPPIRFIKKGLLDFVKYQVELYDIPASLLEFEITESTLLKSEKNVLSTIEGLKELGVKIAIDDFGTGYASLDSLRNFKPDTIKIDRVFIKNISEDNPLEKGIISSTLFLGKSLGMKVVAEGVEEHQQLNFLKQNECDVVQGYIYSKPVRVDTFKKLLSTGYLKAEKRRKQVVFDERRKYYRYQFPFPIAGEMTIIEMNGNKVNVGSTPILIENISLGGLKIVSSLKLPVISTMKFNFRFQILNEQFDTAGIIKWYEEDSLDIFYYGISMELNRITEDRLASVINKLSAFHKKNEKIPDTNFIYEDAHTYLRKKFL
ncbi:diguanylate cyclase/phosphodiesterase with PAS/PAC sensor(s) [Ureibacillus xyleni]|uniref:Diguanylate cyclase/phosphodiesterase with PAS/PAC sensor(S) n=1 Tax=Ureibacillus xyleni TaxID=614648 RepID=A0A285TRA7_9BACL|nr:EAL domain-containing protein [Ureibacillus xyleni]SOC25723.1 diguanylate cyclase/phosphodiesterase with PAS/PAC sensor(s) [Ureibacillus xyleni]